MSGTVLFSDAMRKEDILAYVQRPWAEIERSKRRWIAEQAAQMTPAEKLAVGDMLRNHALAVHPDWPTEEQRREDLAVHIRVSEALRSVKPKGNR